MFGGYSAKKLKPHLKMASSRFQIASNKKAAISKKQMREIALMLTEEPPKEELAKIKAEALIREDNAIEAYEILQLECELLAERIKLIDSMRECPADLLSCVSTLIWAADRVDISELPLIKKQFRYKYGKEFEQAAMNNVGGVLNERVVSKLSVQPPAAALVLTYLEKICDLHEVNWKPMVKTEEDQVATAAPVGYSVQVAAGTGLGPVVMGTADADEEIHYQPSKPDPSIPVVAPSADVYVPQNNNDNNDFGDVDIFVPTIPTAPPGGSTNDDDKKDVGDGGASTTTSGTSSFADLEARFNQLNKK